MRVVLFLCLVLFNLATQVKCVPVLTNEKVQSEAAFVNDDATPVDQHQKSSIVNSVVRPELAVGDDSQSSIHMAGIAPDNPAPENTLVNPKLDHDIGQPGTDRDSESLPVPVAHTESLSENAAFSDDEIQANSIQPNIVNREAAFLETEPDIQIQQAHEAALIANQTAENPQDAEAPSGGIASQSEADEQEEQSARDPDNVHAVAPSPKPKNDVESVPVVAYQHNPASDVASEIFASYAAERLRRDRIGSMKQAGVHSVERDVQVDPEAVAREAAERRRALARDPDKAWHNAPPQHLYTGYTYRPPHSWGSNVTQSASTAAVAKSDVYEGDKSKQEMEIVDKRENKAVPLSTDRTEGMNNAPIKEEAERKKLPEVEVAQAETISHKDTAVGESIDTPNSGQFEMVKKGGGSASKMLVVVAAIATIAGALKLCSANDRRSLMWLRRFGQPKEHV